MFGFLKDRWNRFKSNRKLYRTDDEISMALSLYRKANFEIGKLLHDEYRIPIGQELRILSKIIVGAMNVFILYGAEKDKKICAEAFELIEKRVKELREEVCEEARKEGE